MNEIERIAKFAAHKAVKFREQAFGDSRVEDAANVLEDIAHMLSSASAYVIPPPNSGDGE